MPEGDVGELTAPLGGDADTTTEGTELVADVFPEVEASVGKFPNTVNTMDTGWFRQHIFKINLK